MIYTVYIDGNIINSRYVKDVTTSKIEIEFAGQKLISSKIDIVLSNDIYMFDDRQNTGGFFDDNNWYNGIVQVYCSDNEKIWEGRLKKIKKNDKNRTVTLVVSDYIQDMVDTVCVISKFGVTVAEAMYDILTNPNYLNIPEDRLIVSSFLIAIAKQRNQLIDINISAKDDLKCIEVLEELCRISNSHIYQVENKIGCLTWDEYSGMLGVPITDSDYIPGSYSDETEDSKIINEYSIVRKDGSGIAYETGQNLESIRKYGGGKVFIMPRERNDGTTPNDFKIIYCTAQGANEVGQSILQRYAYMKKLCQFSTGYHMSFVRLGDIVDMRFKPFIREPVRIIGIKYDYKKNIIQFEAEYVNYPEIVSLDIISPQPVRLLKCIVLDGYIAVIWSKSKETIKSYQLYFSTSPEYWSNEFSNGYISPITIPAPNINYIDGDCYYLVPFTTGMKYYFCVTTVDFSYNESQRSNVLSIHSVTTSANLYRLTGNIITGLILDITNPKSGTVPDEFTTYSDLDNLGQYDDITAVYESQELYSDHGFLYLQYIKKGDVGNIKIQYRTSPNGVIWTAWSAKQDAMTLGLIDAGGAKYFQYRVLFYSTYYTDSDTFYVKSIEEAT